MAVKLGRRVLLLLLLGLGTAHPFHLHKALPSLTQTPPSSTTTSTLTMLSPSDEVFPGLPAAAAPFVALAIVVPTLLVLNQVASDARSIGWERSRRRRFLIRWYAPHAARFESPSGGSSMMVAGEGNSEAFSSLQECLALGKQLERTFGKGGKSRASAPADSTLSLRFDADGNPVLTESGGGGGGGANPVRAGPLRYQIYEVTDDSLLVRGSWPKPINAAGVGVRKSAERARKARDPLASDSLGDAWREMFESYADEIDDEWLRFRQSLMTVGGSRLEVERPNDAAPGTADDDADAGDDDDDPPGRPEDGDGDGPALV
jgi:hypothetical protein